MSQLTNHNSINDEPVIGVTMGDPAGIGPEVVVKALCRPGRKTLRQVHRLRDG